MSFDLSEVTRQIANLVRIGRVAQLDEANARVKLDVAGLQTDWLPWSAMRAGKTRSWSAPQVGEQVILASPYGDLGQAVILGSLFSDENPAPAQSKDQETILYPDGAKQDYNSAAHTYLLDVPAGGKITLRCGPSSIELSDAGVKILGPRIDLNE